MSETTVTITHKAFGMKAPQEVFSQTYKKEERVALVEVFRNVYGKISCFVNIGERTYWLKHGW